MQTDHMLLTSLKRFMQQNTLFPYQLRMIVSLIWSHYPHTEPITAHHEAKLLRTLLQNNITLTNVGEYEPPPTAEPLATHNLKVAQFLNRWEHSA